MIEGLFKFLTDLYMRTGFKNVRFSIVDFYDGRGAVDDNFWIRVI
jgi:hypothetical protein